MVLDRKSRQLPTLVHPEGPSRRDEDAERVTVCWVVYLYESQVTEGAELVGKYLRWPEHKFEGGFCIRCGAARKG